MKLEIQAIDSENLNEKCQERVLLAHTFQGFHFSKQSSSSTPLMHTKYILNEKTMLSCTSSSLPAV